MKKNSVEQPLKGRKAKREAKGRMGNFLMFLPNMVILLGRLLKDSRVSNAEKALFLGAIVYVISPIDLIPDMLPFIGQVDDIYMVALTLMRLINRTDERVVREHWSGGGDIVSLSDSIAKLAPMLLPKRVSRILNTNVEFAPAAKALGKFGNEKGKALVMEIPEMETGERINTSSSMPN